MSVVLIEAVPSMSTADFEFMGRSSSSSGGRGFSNGDKEQNIEDGNTEESEEAIRCHGFFWFGAAAEWII